MSLKFATETIGSLAQATPNRNIPDWQKAAGTNQEFDVASIHLAKPGPFMTPSFELGIEDTPVLPGGRFFASFALEDYIEFAYKIMPTPEQQRGLHAALPRWAQDEYFVIRAQASGDPNKDQMRLMMQSLLAERFRLRIHFETRIEPVLNLVLIHPGKPGYRIQPHSKGFPCEAQWVLPPDPSSPALPPGGFAPNCGSFDGIAGPNRTFLAGGRNVTLEQLAAELPNMEDLGRPVVNRTGLDGRFDFTLQWVPERNRRIQDTDIQPDVSGPTLAGALAEQLGMKLQPGRDSVQTLVIDHVEPPTVN